MWLVTPGECWVSTVKTSSAPSEVIYKCMKRYSEMLISNICRHNVEEQHAKIKREECNTATFETYLYTYTAHTHTHTQTRPQSVLKRTNDCFYSVFSVTTNNVKKRTLKEKRKKCKKNVMLLCRLFFFNYRNHFLFRLFTACCHVWGVFLYIYTDGVDVRFVSFCLCILRWLLNFCVCVGAFETTNAAHITVYIAVKKEKSHCNRERE